MVKCPHSQTKTHGLRLLEAQPSARDSRGHPRQGHPVGSGGKKAGRLTVGSSTSQPWKTGVCPSAHILLPRAQPQSPAPARGLESCSGGAGDENLPGPCTPRLSAQQTAISLFLAYIRYTQPHPQEINPNPVCSIAPLSSPEFRVGGWT